MRHSEFDAASPDFECGLAIVIGINTYHEGIPPLTNAVRDANAVADTLEGQGFEVLRLLDGQATASALSELLTHHLPSLQPPPDRLLLYFAGHGLAHTDDEHRLSGFLLPADARRDDPSSYLPMASLRQALRDLACRHLLLILDCCFAGAFPHSASRDLRAPDAPAPLFLERFRHFSSRRSFQLLVSTAHDELASDRLLSKPAQESLGDGSHSPFALALLQALRFPSPADVNQDGLLTASELATFLRDRLVDLLPAHSQQTPGLWPLDWHDGGEFLFHLSESFPALPLAAPLSQRSNPYLGLRPFASAHRHLFFGRERLVDSLHEHLRAHPLLLLCGPSGAGKSSTVHAGLLPRLGDDPSWCVPPSLRPSTQPLQALSAWLAALEPGHPAPSAANLASHPRAAAEHVLAFLSRNSHLSLLLVVDPLEELVTTCTDDAARLSFLKALGGLLQQAHPRLRLLWLLRADFEPHFLALLRSCGLSSAQWHDNRRPLPPMNRDELRRCIEKPAEACVLFFEPGLIERLLDDVEQMPGALPLLSVALSELFDAYLASGRNDRTLSFEDYRHIGGGIAGALQRRAELVFSGAPSPASDGQPLRPGGLAAFQNTLRNVLLRMVSLEGGGLARRRVSRAELDHDCPEENARVRQVLRALETSRLVVASDDGGPCVEPAHDALLSAWPRLHDWARQAQRELLLLRRVSHAASEWHRHRRSNDFLWADGRLEQLGLAPGTLRRTESPLALPTVSPRGTLPTSLGFNAVESGFIRASATRRSFLRTRRSSLGLSVIVVLVLLTLAALFKAQEAEANAALTEAQRQIAKKAEAKAIQSAKDAEAKAKEASDSARTAREQRGLAEESARTAREQRELAEESARTAKEQRGRAETNALTAESNARRASEQQRLAEANARESQLQEQRAETHSREAQRQRGAAEHNAQRASEQQRLAEANASEALSQKNTSEANAREARKQQQAAETNAQEAERQSHAAESNSREARRQQQTAELNFREAQTQQQNATANAAEAQRQQAVAETSSREAQRQKEAAETNALEARRQQATAEANAAEVQRQKDRAYFSNRLSNARRLIDTDPTQALLLLQELDVQDEVSANDWLQTSLDVGQRAFSRSILEVGNASIMMVRFSPDGTRVLITLSDGTARLWNADGTGGPITFQGHKDSVNTAVFSPDGSRILTASDDGTARLWNVDGTEEPTVFSVREVSLTSAVFSPEGSRILVTADDGSIRIWTIGGKANPVVIKGNDHFLDTAVFSADGSRILYTADGYTVHIRKANGKGAPVVLAGHKSHVNTVVFNHDASLVLTSSDDGTACLWNSDGTVQKTFSGHSGQVKSAVFSPDETHVLTASVDGTARLWAIQQTSEPVVFTGHKKWVNSASFSPDGDYILTSSDDGTARLWRVDGLEPPLVFAGHKDWVSSAIFSPDGSQVVTVSDDSTVRIWSLGNSGAPFLFDAITDLPLQGQATPTSDGAYVFIASDGGTVKLWRMDGTDTFTLEGHDNLVNTVTVSPDGTLVLTASDDNTARLWSVATRKQLRVFKGHDDSVTTATFSPDGSLVITASADNTVRLWRTDGKGEPRILRGHEDTVKFALFSPDGSRVLTASDDETLRLWRTDGKGEPRILRGREATASLALFSPDGTFFLTLADDGMARLWRTDGKGGARLLAGHAGTVQSAAFSPNGSLVITGGDDNIARIWRTDGTGEPVILQGHRHMVVSVQFNSTGTQVLTASEDGTARLWRLNEPLAPLVLQHEEVLGLGETISAFFTKGGTEIQTVCQGGRVRRWSLNPSHLGAFLQKATTACLPPLEREQYLFEPTAVARAAYERCERSHGRTP